MVSVPTAIVIVILMLRMDGNEAFSYGVRHTRVPITRSRISSLSTSRKVGQFGHPDASDGKRSVKNDYKSVHSSLFAQENPDRSKDIEAAKASVRRKIMRGSFVASSIISLPLYCVGFGLFGYKNMWTFSEWMYNLASPSEGHLHRHFKKIQKFMSSQQKKGGIKKSRCYRIHPTFAGLSLITTALLAFRPNYPLLPHFPHELLRVSNISVCFVSAIAAIPLGNTMLGNASAKKWNGIQVNLSMILAALTFCPGSVGRLMVHLNWSILFCGGVLERIYVLCILSQLHASDRKLYMKLYSPLIKVATLASIPMGITTFFLFN